MSRNQIFGLLFVSIWSGIILAGAHRFHGQEADDTPTLFAAAADTPGASLAKEPGWYVEGTQSVNLINVEYFDAVTHELHFSGQRIELHEDWQGLAQTLDGAADLGFVKLKSTFICLRNLSSVVLLADKKRASLTFRDGATLAIGVQEFNSLIQHLK